MIRRSCKRAFVFIVALVVGGGFDLLLARPAHAIIGMPFTPMSYAGVARRTTRRAVMFGGAAGYGYGAAYAAPVAAPAYAYPPPVYPAPAYRPVYTAPAYPAAPPGTIMW
jgi:hypothetical protein